MTNTVIVSGLGKGYLVLSNVSHESGPSYLAEIGER